MISNRTRNVHDFRLSRHTILKLYGIIHKRKIYENQAKGGLWFLAILTGQEPPAPQRGNCLMYQTVTSFVFICLLLPSASVDADICAGRCGHLRRSMRTSASVDADICVGRCGHLRRSIRTSASVDTDNKSGCIKAAWVYKKVQQRLLKLRLRGYGRDAIPS